jgi:UDP-3-O-[3-hydroxymyristoyl] glucosamine N-acyltransferase
MNITLLEIANQFQSKGFVLGSPDDGQVLITRISAIETSGPGDLVFMDKAEYLPFVVERKPTAVVTSKAHKDAVAAAGVAVVVAPNVALAHALVKQKYADRDFTKGWSGKHASAVVHPTADVHASVVLEPHVVIGAGSKIGEGCRIMAGSVVESGATIGARSVIHPNVVIGFDCHLGEECVIESGTVIGSAGFGFAQDEKRKSHTIPQTGNVVLEDRVRIGGNGCVDRGTYSETRIGAGTKIDNHCHIAHNVQIGKDCLLTAMFVVAGSSKIGDRMMASGNTGILDHVEVCSDVVLLHRAGVNSDVTKPGMYAGSPIQPFGEYMKNTAALRSANDMRKRIMALEKKLGMDGSAEA